jgi:hypothetical protein
MAAVTAVVMVLTLAQPVHAAGAVTVDNQQLQNRLFTAYMRLHNPGPNGLRDMVLSASMIGWRQKHPMASSEQILQHMAIMRNYFDENLTAKDLQRPYYEFTIRMLNLVAAHPEGAIGATAVRELLEGTVGKDIKSFGTMADYVAGSQQQYQWFNKMYVIQDAVWSRVTQFGQNDSAFRAAWDGAIGSGINVSSNATTEQLLADPEIATFINTEAILDQLSNQAGYLQEGQRQLTVNLERIQQQNAATLEQLAQLNAAYPVSAGGPRPTVEVQAAERLKAAQRQEILDGAATAIEILSTLIGFADPRAGKIASGVGKAAIQVATAINAFVPAVAGLSLGEAIFSMSTLTLTGNVLGAITSLLPLFSGVPSPESQMLEQLQEIRQDIAALATTMNDRFDRLEQGLATIYGDMLTKFDEIMHLTNATNYQLANLESQLLRLGPQLDMWGAENVKAQQEMSLNDTNVMVNKYIDYEERYGQPIPSFNSTSDRYTEPEAILRNTALTLATRAPMIGPNTGYSTADPVTVLNTWEANGTLGYLEWYAGTSYGLPTSSTLTKPNPATWAYAARAYSLLQLQNPDYAKQVSASETARIIATGQDILTVNRALSKPKDPGSDGKRTNVLFAGLTRDYAKAAEDLKTQLDEVRKQYSENKEYNLFGPIDQPLTGAGKLAEPAAVATCGGSSPSLTRPNNVSLTQAPNEFALAQYAHADKPKVYLCYDASLVNVKRSFTTKFNITKADLRVQMKLRVEWGGEKLDFRSWTKVTPLGEVCREYRDSGEVVFCYELDDYLNNWDANYRSGFESGATYGSTDSVLATVRTRMTNFMAGRRAGYYSHVYTDLGDPAKNLFKANAQVTKMAKLTKVYSALGFANTMQHDDLLRAVLYGANRIVADDTNGAMVRDTFAIAVQAYAGCNAPNWMSPCTAGNGAFNPLSGQRHLTDCAAFGPEMSDPVGNCVIDRAKARNGFLADRIEAASARIAAGDYTEGMPEVQDLITTMNTIDASVRG